MTRTYVPHAALAMALALAGSGASTAAADDGLLHLRAWAVNLNNGARTNTVDIVIERWSTPEEIDKLKGVLLACCHLEFDRRGRVIDWQERRKDCGHC